MFSFSRQGWKNLRFDSYKDGRRTQACNCVGGGRYQVLQARHSTYRVIVGSLVGFCSSVFCFGNSAA